MFLKILQRIFLLITYFQLIFCDKSTDFLNDPISNQIIFAERKNYVLFALSKTTNETIYENLINAFLELEKQAELNFTYVHYDNAISFGNGYKQNFKMKDKMYESYGKLWCTKNDKKTCPDLSYKEFTVIISDVCLPFLNRQLDDYQKCSSEYRKIVLMLPTKNDVDECIKQMKPNLYIELFSSELNSNEYQTYLDMKVWYQTTWLKSIFNILVVVDWSYQKGLTTLFDPPKIDYRAYDLCNQGALAAYFQFYNGTFSLNGNMTAPVNFEDSRYIVKNYFSLFGNRIKIGNNNCDFVNSFLTTLRDIPLENGKDQYNLLILSDPYPKCLNSKLLWNNTNRHLEIVVLGVQQPEKDYSKFISFSKNSLNHLNYYTSSNEGISNFWGDTSVCRTYMDQTNLTEDTMLITTTTSMPQKEAEDNNKLWIIIGGSVVVLLIIGAFVLIYFKLRQSKNTDSASGWSIEDNSSPQSLSIFLKKTFPTLFVEEPNVFINFDEVLGQGSTCTVYKAKINTSSLEEKLLAIKIPLQYDDSQKEQITHELNIVSKLKHHSSICSPLFCTTFREIPCIIFEKMDTNLLNFVRNYNFEKKDESDFPPKMLFLQILWQISKALEYIASKNIIHRDVAARNILFSAPNIAKLSDYGLWCESNTDSQMYFSSSRKKLPSKWLSIEALKDNIFSEKSDVWSFGIVMYEMWSGGSTPYANKEGIDLIEYLLEGNRLEIPAIMPNNISYIMESCWKAKKEERPNFYQLKTKITKLLENERPIKYR